MSQQELLRKLEQRLTSEYKDTEAVIRAKIAYFTEDFDKDNKLHQKMVKDGVMSRQEYKRWYKDQMFAQKWANKMTTAISEDLTNANVTASKIINNNASAMFIDGATEAVKELQDYDPFEVFDTRQIKNIADENAKHLPESRVKIPKDQKWNEKRIKSSLMQSAVKGESAQQLAGRLLTVVGMNRKSAIRNARTMMTGSHNMGKLELGNEALEMGLDVRKKWIATFDNRTRNSHASMHEEVVDMDEEFSNGLMFPADPDGDPAEVYNCRCTMVITHDPKRGGMSKEEFKENVKENEAEKEAFKQANKDLKNGVKPQATQTPAKQPKEFTFTPAKTLEEAEAYASQFVDDNIFGAVGVSYKGVSVDVANEVNKTIGKFYTTFDVNKLGGIIAPSGNTKMGKLMQNATAGYMPVRQSLFLNRNTLKNMKVATKHLAEEHSVVTDILKHPEKYDMTKASSTLARIVNNSRASGRSTIPESIEDVINHELGHSLEKRVKNSGGWTTVMDNMPKYNQKLSGYACENPSEYVAESFCSYMRGEKNADPELIKIFESFKR